MATSQQRLKFYDYDGFVEKFKPKKTTDDCYTPPEIYDEVLSYVGELVDLTGRPIVRPFYPGSDYEAFDYPDNCVVVDNPPFSIYAKIVRWYLARGIDFFLFAPALTQTIQGADCCYIITGFKISYENGAVVRTSFTTSLCKERVWCNPELYRRLDVFNKTTKNISKFELPDEVTSSALLQKIALGGVDFRIMPDECTYISKLENSKNSPFGGGFILSERAAEKKVAAEKR